MEMDKRPVACDVLLVGIIVIVIEQWFGQSLDQV